MLRQWAQTNAGGNVTTDQFIALAESISGEELDDLFEEWLFTPRKPSRPIVTQELRRCPMRLRWHGPSWRG